MLLHLSEEIECNWSLFSCHIPLWGVSLHPLEKSVCPDRDSSCLEAGCDTGQALSLWMGRSLCGQWRWNQFKEHGKQILPSRWWMEINKSWLWVQISEKPQSLCGLGGWRSCTWRIISCSPDWEGTFLLRGHEFKAISESSCSPLTGAPQYLDFIINSEFSVQTPAVIKHESGFSPVTPFKRPFLIANKQGGAPVCGRAGNWLMFKVPSTTNHPVILKWMMLISKCKMNPAEIAWASPALRCDTLHLEMASFSSEEAQKCWLQPPAVPQQMWCSGVVYWCYSQLSYSFWLTGKAGTINPMSLVYARSWVWNLGSSGRGETLLPCTGIAFTVSSVSQHQARGNLIFSSSSSICLFWRSWEHFLLGPWGWEFYLMCWCIVLYSEPRNAPVCSSSEGVLSVISLVVCQVMNPSSEHMGRHRNSMLKSNNRFFLLLKKKNNAPETHIFSMKTCFPVLIWKNSFLFSFWQ